VGVLNTQKNVVKLVEALALLPDDYCLLIVGDGVERPRLVETARELHVDHKIIFAGKVPYPDLPPYYRTADVFCLVSILEGMPKVVLEALASGVPVITSNSFSSSPILDEFIVRLKQNSADEIAKEIQNVVESGKRIDPTLIRMQYDWNQIALQIQHIYNDLIGSA